MPYSLRVLLAFVGGVLAACSVLTALAVIAEVHPEESRWSYSLAFAGIGTGLVAACLVRDQR